MDGRSVPKHRYGEEKGRERVCVYVCVDNLPSFLYPLSSVGGVFFINSFLLIFTLHRKDRLRNQYPTYLRS